MGILTTLGDGGIPGYQKIISLAVTQCNAIFETGSIDRPSEY